MERNKNENVNEAKSGLEVAIMLTFFVRVETLSRVFEQIRKARPKTLFLASDGPREGREDDIIKVQNCRTIVSNVDWECDVHRYYSDENLGILLNSRNAKREAFKLVDKCIFLEDDMLPSQDFFDFCNDMLKIYENDKRVSIISGANPYDLGLSNGDGYFFVKHATSGATAYWRRTYFALNNLRQKIITFGGLTKDELSKLPSNTRRNIEKRLKKQINQMNGLYLSGELVRFIHFFIGDNLGIMPNVNLVSSISISKDSAHSYDDLRKLPKVLRNLQRYPISKLNYSTSVVTNPAENIQIRQKIYRILAIGHPFVQFFRWVQTFFLILKYGSTAELRRKLFKWLKNKLTTHNDING